MKKISKILKMIAHSLCVIPTNVEGSFNSKLQSIRKISPPPPTVGSRNDNTRGSSQFKLLNKIVIVLLLMLTFSQATTAFALTAAQLKAQRERDYYAAIAAAAAAAAEKKKQQAAVVTKQIQNVDSNITQTQTEMAGTDTQLVQTQNSIDDLKKQITEQENNLIEQKGKLNNVVTSLYMEGDSGLFESVLSSNSLSDVITTQQYYEAISQQINTIIDKIAQLKAELKTKKDEADTQLVKLNELKTSQIESSNYLAGQKTMKTRLLTDTTKAISDLNAQAADALQKERAAEGEIKRMEQAASQGSSWVRSGSSATGFMWPVNGSKGCGFGYSDCYFAGVFHTGVDLKAFSGANIMASKAGQVVEVRDGMGNTYSYSKSYGNYVKIRHEGGVYTMYGHLLKGSISVGVGDSVTQGQLIGSMGNTGYSTGTHLHFEMRGPDDIAVDPEPSLP